MADREKSNNEKKQEASRELIDNIAEASKNARSIYFIYVGTLVYSAITVAGTSDRQIVLNEPTTLPIINLNVSLEGFFILAPLISIFFFIYFQLYLYKLKQLLDDLRTNFPDINESRQVYPWMLNFASELGGGLVGRTQQFIVNFSVWWFMPVVLMLLAAWYLKTHDKILGMIIGLMPLLGVGIVTLFRINYQIPSGQSVKFNFSQFRGKLLLPSIVLLYEILFFTSYLPAALEGKRILGSWPCVDLSYEDLSDGRLQGVNFAGAVLKKAKLRNAKLQGANFSDAVLDNSDLRKAELQGVIFIGASLQGVQLDSLDLQGVDFRDLDLRGFNLSNSNLQNANFRGALLDKTTLLTGAILDSADFRGTVFMMQTLDSLQQQVVRFLKPIFRSKPLDSLSSNMVGTMLKEKGFYDLSKNPTSEGFENRFELQQTGQVLLDLASDLIWQQGGSDNVMLYKKAQEYIAELNAKKFANFTDWRLPTLEEAMTLMERTKLNGDLYIDRLFDNKQTWIWTADRYSASEAWLVNFYSGDCVHGRVFYVVSSSVRAVRSGR